MRVRLTQEGFDKLQAEMKYLATVKRREVVKAIEVARAHGDLRENAEYDAAKNEQGLLEKRIAELETMLSNGEIIDEDLMDASKAYLGATVTIKDLDSGRELKYMLVSKEESDFSNGKISIDSPVGKGLLGQCVDAEVEIVTPARTLRYKILQIER